MVPVYTSGVKLKKGMLHIVYLLNLNLNFYHNCFVENILFAIRYNLRVER